jgi:PAS domain S-box-containing protein
MQALLPPDEPARLEALRQYDVLDTAPEREFDDIAHLAAQICGTPICAITLADRERLWFKSRIGLPVSETPRALSFCAHAILDDDLLLVPDASSDPRFADNPLVTAEPHLRFYAGVPLVTPEGHSIGTLCVLDTIPRQIDQAQQDALRRLARQTVVLLEARPDSTTEKKQSRHARQQAEQQRLILAAEAARRDADSLKGSEERYRRLFEAARDGILILDADSGEIEDVNPYLCELLGCGPGDFLGKHLWQIGAFHDIAASQEAFRTLQEKQYIRYNDLPLQTKDGHLAPVEFISNVYAAGDKNVIQCNIRDISERKQAAMRVQEALRFLQSTLDALASHIAVLDEQGEIIAVNKAWQQFAEDNGGDIAACGVGANYIAVGADARGAWAAEGQVLAQGLREVMAGQQEAFCVEYPCHSPEQERWFNVCVTRFEGEGPVRVAVAHENITQRKQAEAALSKREEFQRALLDNFPNGSVNVFDRDLRYELAAGRGLEQSGIDPEQLIGRTLAEIFPPDQVALVKPHYEKALSGQTVEFELSLGERCYNICAAPLHVDDGEVRTIVAVAQDITMRKQAEDLIRISEANLAAAQKIAHVGSWVWSLQNLNDLGDNLLSWSDEVFRIFGHQPGAFEASYKAFIDGVHPGDRDRVETTLRSAFTAGRNYSIEHRVVWPDGTERIVQERSNIVHDEHGKPLKMLGTVQDITEQKQLEEAMRQSSEQLRALAASLSTIREEERTQISRDVHDVLGQALTSLKMDVAWLEEKAPRPARRPARLDAAQDSFYAAAH